MARDLGETRKGFSPIGRFLVWTAPSAAVAGACVWLCVEFWGGYSSAATRWTAVASVFAGAALFLALVGLPIAFRQLFALERDLARLSVRTDLQGTLTAIRISGYDLRARMNIGVSPQLDSEFKDWCRNVTAYIERNTDKAEADDFRQAGAGGPPNHELDQKLAYIRDNLIAKVMAGWWL